jgi:hypothetical protein
MVCLSLQDESEFHRRKSYAILLAIFLNPIDVPVEKIENLFKANSFVYLSKNYMFRIFPPVVRKF